MLPTLQLARCAQCVFCILALLTLQVAGNAAEHRVKDVAEFNAAVKKAVAGDTIILGSGEWKDAALLFTGQGTDSAPITLKAEQPGQVKLTGDSSLRLGGSHLVVEGLWFHNAFPLKWDVVMFREDAKKLAQICVLRDCAITQDAVTEDSKERKWVSLYGGNHRVERCHFEGKTSKGTLLVVWLPETAGEPPKHQIFRNYFGARPRLGKNGGEIIRVGDSDTSLQSAACSVRENFFERCDGEVECISNKSCDNEYLRNTFFECQGTLTLRHGNRCLVEGNWFNGNGRSQTGGIRIIGERHVVRANHLEKLQGDGARSAICVMNAIENSPPNGYLQVKEALVAGNMVEDCKYTLVIGYADKDVVAKMVPEVSFEGNILVGSKGPLVELLEPLAVLRWKGNLVYGAPLGMKATEGVLEATEKPEPMSGLPKGVGRETVGTTWHVTLISAKAKQ